MPDIVNRISLAAIGGEVFLVGDGKPLIGLTPDVAEELARNLPRFAALARAIASPLTVASMTDVLHGEGLRWCVHDPELHTGQWIQGTDEICEAGEYEAKTRQVFVELFPERLRRMS